MEFTDLLSAGATVVSNRFIDEYMAGADGNFVKVYLYLLRHAGEEVTCAMAADALECTEADIRRAAAYWEKQGVLGRREAQAVGFTEEEAVAGKDTGRESAGGFDAASRVPEEPARSEKEPVRAAGKKLPDMAKLSGNDEYRELIYVAQRYMKKQLSHMDHMILANLYQNEQIPADVLEYLMEYCADTGHLNMRYAEKVALDWKDRGFKTRTEAKQFSENYTRGMFAVMKAFGINDRRPGDAEKDYIDRWLSDSGFSLEMILEACNRTIGRIHKPSFSYADSILKIWKREGVKSIDDAKAQDALRSAQSSLKSKAQGSSGRPDGAGHGAKRTRFDNFESHGYDYEDLVMGLIRPIHSDAKDKTKKDGE